MTAQVSILRVVSSGSWLSVRNVSVSMEKSGPCVNSYCLYILTSGSAYPMQVVRIVKWAHGGWLWCLDIVDPRVLTRTNLKADLNSSVGGKIDIGWLSPANQAKRQLPGSGENGETKFGNFLFSTFWQACSWVTAVCRGSVYYVPSTPSL